MSQNTCYLQKFVANRLGKIKEPVTKTFNLLFAVSAILSNMHVTFLLSINIQLKERTITLSVTATIPSFD